LAKLRLLNRQRQEIARLKNAFNIGYEKRLNELWFAGFTLPLEDPNLAKCEPFNMVEITDDGEYIGLFRIEPSLTRRNESAGTVEFELKHVFATLLDDILFRYHQTTNWKTRQNIEYLLGKQSTKNWRLGHCDFERYFHYKYENENGLLGPMLAIPQPFDEDYQWTYNTQVYPWQVNLVKPSEKVTCEIRYAKNMREIEREIDPSNIVNRIFPLGFGEGVNQLGIEDVNGGVPYLEDASSIAQFGLKAYVWPDRRFEDAQALKESAQSLLAKWKQPKVVYKVNAADLTKLTGAPIHKFTEGALVRIVDPDFGVIEQRIHMVSKPDITGAPGDIQLEIGSLTDDIATVNADIERKQQVNDAYTQGATNLDSHNYVDNCDATHPAVIRFFLPSDLVNVNTLTLSYETEKFRPYSKATAGGGATTKTTSSGGGTTATSSSGGGTTATSSSGGGVSTSTASGGGTTQSSTSGGGAVVSSSFADLSNRSIVTEQIITGVPYETHIHAVILDGSLNHDHSVSVPNHSHSVSVPSHTHDFNVPNHSHSVTIPNHSHQVTIPNHTHDIVLPDHTHDVLPGIYEVNVSATAVTIKVDGNTVPVTSTSASDIDIIPYLAKDAGGKVTRGTWHEVEITPNDLARINANIISRLFISSHIGGNY
jgi:phage minor structural protein